MLNIYRILLSITLNISLPINLVVFTCLFHLITKLLADSFCPFELSAEQWLESKSER